jgi:uncharacterized protein YecT (DUF1311 family)
MKVFIALLIVLISLNFTFAENKHSLDTEFQKTIDRGLPARDIIQAISYYTERWEKELDSSYGRIMDKTPGEAKYYLRDSQDKWETFRELERKFISRIYAQKQGTIYAIAESSGVLELARKRALAISDYYAVISSDSPKRYLITTNETFNPDQYLNQAYRKLRTLLDKDSRNILLNSQRAWLAHRNLEFQFLDVIAKIKHEKFTAELVNKLKSEFVERRTAVLNTYIFDILEED